MPVSDGVHILLVEDIAIIQRSASVIFESLGCKVDIAENGASALECSDKESYSLILMDLGLPDIDGLTVAETIRKASVMNADAPIVALTAHSDEGYQASCREIGMNGYIVKPLTLKKAEMILNDYVFSHAG